MKRYGVPHPYRLPSLWRSSPGPLRNFPGLITASQFLWDFCKIPQKSSFFVFFSKLFYSIELLHIHITCLHVYIVYIYLHLLPRTPDCVMAEARITEFFGETQI